MIRRHRLRGPTVTMSIYLDPQTDLLILKAKDRSGRSKSAEALIRLRDHWKNSLISITLKWRR